MPIGNPNYEILDDDRLLGESVFYRDNQLVTGNGSPVSVGGGAGGAIGASGTIGASAVVIILADLGLVGKLHQLSVAPDTGCTILVEQSSNGSSYTTLASVTATSRWDYAPLPSESAVTHVRLTRTVGSSVASTYAIG